MNHHRRQRAKRKPVRDGSTGAASRIPADVARRLGYYVYAYVNPVDGTIFYVGRHYIQFAAAKGRPKLRRRLSGRSQSAALTGRDFTLLAIQ